MSRKRLAWVLPTCVLAAGGAFVSPPPTAFFIATAAAVSPFADQDSAQPADDLADAPAAALAAQLMDDIPAGAKVALKPLDHRYAGLESAVADPLYERLLLALSNAAADDVTLVARKRLPAINRSRDEFDQGDIKSLLLNAQADIEIICEPNSNATGITLYCSATRLVNTVTLAMAKAHFPITRDAADFNVALNAIATRLGEVAPPGRIALAPFLDTGLETALTRYIGQRLEDKIVTRMEQRLGSAAIANAVRGTGNAAGSDMPRYRLRGQLHRLDAERFRIDARVLLGERKLIAAGADVAIASVAEGLAASLVGNNAAPEPTRRYEAVAEAVVADRLDAASARRAARNLARARVIAQALGLDAPAVAEVRTEADAVAALGEYLSEGLPVDEQFHDYRAGVGEGSRIGVRLTATVAPVGVASRPAVTAKLPKKVFKAMEPIVITLRSKATVYVGVFSWGADNKVVRLYPNATRKQLVLRAGEALQLPSHGDGTIRSEPLRTAGNLEDHEALIVVAATQRVDYGALAPAAGATLAETMKRAKDGGKFLAALAAAGPSRMSVSVLGYQVHL